MLSILAAATLAPTLHVRVDGEGYMRFAHEGRAVYAREADLIVVGGRLSHSAGAPLLPTVRVPAEAVQIAVDLEGRISVNGAELGRIVLAAFPSASKLTPRGAFTISSLRPTLGNPGEDTYGVIRVGGKANEGVPAIQSPAPRLIVSPVAGGEAVIRVAKESECAASQFLLSDIAEVDAEPSLKAKLESIEIGDAPVIGASRGLDQRQVFARLRQAGFDPERIHIEVPAGAVVRRQSQLVPSESFTKVAIEAAQVLLGTAAPLAARVAGSDFRAPMGDVRLAAENVTANSSGATVVVAVFVNGERFNARSIRVSISSAASVRANTPVTIMMRSGGATVELQGKTRINAFVGQPVTVQTQTGAELSGTLLAPDRVEVKL